MRCSSFATSQFGINHRIIQATLGHNFLKIPLLKTHFKIPLPIKQKRVFKWVFEMRVFSKKPLLLNKKWDFQVGFQKYDLQKIMALMAQCISSQKRIILEEDKSWLFSFLSPFFIKIECFHKITNQPRFFLGRGESAVK